MLFAMDSESRKLSVPSAMESPIMLNVTGSLSSSGENVSAVLLAIEKSSPATIGTIR